VGKYLFVRKCTYAQKHIYVGNAPNLRKVYWIDGNASGTEIWLVAFGE
jgi:hypothetical protein